jgi:hypothetical protein
MSISDLGAIGSMLSALAVMATLIYLSRQVKLGNMLARSQARQRMVEQANQELYQWMGDPNLRDCFTRTGPLSKEEQGKLHFFLLAAMRAREWEWLQYRDGVINEEVYKTYIGVIGLHLGTPRTRRWWNGVGRIGFDPAFVARVDAMIAGQPPVTYYEDIHSFDEAPKAVGRAGRQRASAA